MKEVHPPPSAPSDISERFTPKMLPSFLAPFFSALLTPWPSHSIEPEAVTKTKASLELRLEATGSTCSRQSEEQLSIENQFCMHFQMKNIQWYIQSTNGHFDSPQQLVRAQQDWHELGKGGLQKPLIGHLLVKSHPCARPLAARQRYSWDEGALCLQLLAPS